MKQRNPSIFSWELIRDAQISRTLMLLYKRVCFVLIPVILLYYFSARAGIFILDKFQYVQLTIALVMGFYVLAFSRVKLAQDSFIYMHWLFLLAVTFTNAWWFSERPDDQSALSLMLTVFLVGIILIQPLLTILYFSGITALMTILSFVNKSVDPKYIFYILFCAVIIVIFGIWRSRLARQKDIAEASYHNLFDDLADQAYVLDENHHIMEINRAAREYLEKHLGYSPIDKPFEAIFSLREEIDKTRFQQALKGIRPGEKKKVEVTCEITGEGVFMPKEMTLRKSKYFGHEVTVITIRIIKEQRDFENRLIESKENIARVLDNINSFVFNITFHKNGDHQVNYVSQKVKEVYGIEPDEYITLLKSGRLNEIFYHEDRAETVQLFNDLVRTRQQNRIKFRIVRNGEIRWVEEKIFPESNLDENMVHLFGIVTDITDQIDALASLELSEKRYRLIFERNLAGVYKTHVDGTILDSNPAFAKILGYDSIEELKKVNIRDLYIEETGRKDYLDNLREHGHLNNYISRLRRKDGKELVLNNNVSIQADEDGILNIIEGTLIDITEIESAAKALKQKEEKYRLLFEESNAGILLLVPGEDDAYITDLNPVGARLLGWSPMDLIGKGLREIAVNSGELLINLTLQKSKRERLETEWVFRKSDGSSFDAEVSFAAIQAGGEKIMQLMIKDISERKKNEEMLRENQRNLKNMVDSSPSAILIFDEQELVYMNPTGDKLYLEKLNSKSTSLFTIFPAKLEYLIRDLLSEKSNEQNAFTEIELGEGDRVSKYSLQVVQTIYQGKQSQMFMLQDITLQIEYNRQRLRAEIAEETNKRLQDEIERHRATQAELLEKTFWLNALFESSYNLFILSLDVNYCISSFNENFRRMIVKSLGVEPKIGDKFLSFFNPKPEAKEKIEARFERVLKGETLEFVSHFTALNGEVWVESFLNPVKIDDREVAEISFISHEITEKIESQRKIKQSEANNRAILLAIPDILTKVNRQGVFTDFRMSQANGLDILNPFLKTGQFTGNSIFDVVENQQIAQKFIENVKRVLETNELLTDTVELVRDGFRPIYYENRFSRMSDDEVVVLSRNVTETIEYEAMLVESVKEKEVLLKEVHHRVKNNLQVINSILNLQSSYVEDPRTLEIINESQNRIRSMSYIHESLYQTKDFSSINFSDYISNLVQNLVHSYQLYHDKIDLTLRVEPVKLALDQAIPCGLILNELVSNALKYAYPGEERGEIVIEVYEKENKLVIGVEDFGIGLPKGFRIENSESLGLSLVYTLVDQLDGELNLKTLGGTKFLITFEKQEI